MPRSLQALLVTVKAPKNSATDHEPKKSHIMRANAETVLVGSKVVLVPYSPEHVTRYHEWMQDGELRQLTASEPLSLEQEFEMQRKWREDEDKLTFILLAQPDEMPHRLSQNKGYSPSDPPVTALAMVGDVNLFLKGSPDDVEEFEAEAEIMIAEPGYRRKGLAIEALRLMLHYATGHPYFSYNGCPPSPNPQPPLPIPATSLVTRISEKNAPSIHLFEKLGFSITKRVAVFEEVEMRWNVQNQTINQS